MLLTERAIHGTLISVECEEQKQRLHGQAVKTSPFHGGNTGSIPVGVIKNPERVCGPLAQLVRATGS